MKVVEIFYSLQGEGRYTGVPAVFVRLAGCNMRCWFCDTDYEDGVEMTEEDIYNKVCEYGTRYVVVTGGEPTLQLTASLVDRLHDAGKYVMMETNGSRALPEGCDVDWVTCSPKGYVDEDGRWVIQPVRLQHIDELKVVYEDDGRQDMGLYERIPAKEYRLQPCDTGDEERNGRIREGAIGYVLGHPMWRLSLQVHKVLGVR